MNRLSRVIGHLEYVKRMISQDEDCADVLAQIAAARSALNGLGKQIINEHILVIALHMRQRMAIPPRLKNSRKPSRNFFEEEPL